MANSRPRIDLPLSKGDLIMHFLGVLSIIAMVVVFCTMYLDLPAEVPTHWDFSGNINDWGSKSVYIWIAVTGIVMYVGMAVLGFFPHLFNYTCEVTEENAERLYRAGRFWINVLNVEMIWMFAVIFGVSIHNAANHSNSNLLLGVVLAMTVIIAFTSILMIVRLNKAGEAR